MKIFDLSKKELVQDLSGHNDESYYFIVATGEEFNQVQKSIGIHAPPLKKYDNLDEYIRFEHHSNYDFLSFIYFELEERELIFEVFNLYFSSNYLSLVVEEDGKLHEQFIEELHAENLIYEVGKDNLATLYHHFLYNSFLKMFETLCRYESVLSDVENDILVQHKDYEFENLVVIKNLTFQVKKCMRLLLYVGDQLLLNDNNYIPKHMMRLFTRLNVRINRLYEFSVNIHEVSEHLMELYDSSMNARTNDMINKLTVFTVFATPISVLTGLYGMNFVNMPELQNPNGYFILLGVIVIILLVIFAILKKIKLL